MASSKRMLLPTLPSDLIEEILCRTPAESLIRFKSACKEWYDLISSNKRFIYNHLKHSQERFLRIENHQTVQIIDPVKIIQSESPIPDEFCHVSYPIVSPMVHCDGLMLCLCADWMTKERSEYAGLAVWNPVMRKTKWIEPSVCYWKTDYFGFGYKNTCRDNYKILRFWDPISFRDDKKSDPKCEIYEFKSESWRSLDAEFDWQVDFECKGVSVNGNMYWAGEKKEDLILSFDFSNETFNDTCVCPPVCETRLLGCFNGDRLSLVQQDDEEENEIEVWMTNKLSDEVVSFTKYFNVNTRDIPALILHGTTHPDYFIGKNRNIMAWCEGYVEVDDKWYTFITLYDIDEGGIRTQEETGRCLYDHKCYYPYICSYVYVPSLIPVVWSS